MATGNNEEDEMDQLIAEIERVMEDESGSGGATFGMLRNVCSHTDPHYSLSILKTG